MTRLLALVFVAACTAGIPGDPDTFAINGEPKAGYAWSGPASWCCTGPEDPPHVAWQIWFTNTEICPTSHEDMIASLTIISPDVVQQAPSTALPTLTSMTLQILFPGDGDLPSPVAELGVVPVVAYPPSGTLMLRTYSADEISGVIAAQAEDLQQKQVEITGRFDAHRCDRIHD